MLVAGRKGSKGYIERKEQRYLGSRSTMKRRSEMDEARIRSLSTGRGTK